MMRYMNRRKNTLGILPLLATVLLSAASCTESVVQDMETAGDSGAIRFSLPTLTRSAIGSADDLNTDGQSFSVWGSYRYTRGKGRAPPATPAARTTTCRYSTTRP